MNLDEILATKTALLTLIDNYNCLFPDIIPDVYFFFVCGRS